MLKQLLVCLALSNWILFVSAQALPANEELFRQQIATLLDADDANTKVTLSGEILHGTKIIRRMYESSGFRALWSDEAIAALATAVDSLAADGLAPADYRFQQIVGQLQAPAISALTPAQAAEFDVLLTEAFLRAVYDLYFGKADPERLDPDINFARTYQGKDPVPFLLEHIAQARIDEVFDWARPGNKLYKRLRNGLARYREYQTAGGWNPIPAGATLKSGTADPRVALVRARLAITGDLPADATVGGDPVLFDEVLESAARRFQKRHGIDVDGAVGPKTLQAMNVPVQDRIEQIRVNLERARWIMHEAHDEFLVADIAGFDVYWVKDGNVLWKEQIQVGKEYTKTPVFTGEIEYLDFNPTWTIPPGILRRSIIPGLKQDAGYLDKRGYQMLTPKGEPVDPQTVDWAGLKGFPFVVRQPPGPDNALGQVKFLFPNPHFVFLHDTNHRELFDRSRRTFSSGCIRVRNPLDLAERLLASQGDWTREKIDAVIASGETKRVNLERRMRILIAYNTARVPINEHQVNFRPDIYRRDAKVLAALNGPFTLRQRDTAGKP